MSKNFIVLFLLFTFIISCDDAKPAKDYNNDTDTAEIADSDDITTDDDLISDSDEAEDLDISVDEEADEDAVTVPDEDETAQDEDEITVDEDTVVVDDEDGTIQDEDSTVTPDEDETAQDEDAVIVPDEDETTVDTDNEISDEDIPDTLFIRAIAGNISSGSYQSYDPGHGIRIFKGLQGDIFMVQEFNYKDNSTSDYREMVDEMCGTDCYYSVGTGQIPNGVVSRWPITSSGLWDDPNISNRDLDWAVIDIPGPRDIFAISVHLHTSPSSDQVTAAQVIAKEVSKLMLADPDRYYFVVGGDFNGTSAVSNNGFGAYNGTNIFYVAGPHPVSEDGDYGTNANRSNQYDFVLADYDLNAFQIPVKYTDFTYANGLVFDTREYSQAELDANFSPALTGDSGSSQMQHMAIVKDFNITLEK